MQALIVREHGPLENLLLEEVPDPAPGPGQVLIDVHAASINFPDLLVIGGTYQVLPPRPFSPGKDMAGVVAAVGAGKRPAFQSKPRLEANAASSAAAVTIHIWTEKPVSTPVTAAKKAMNATR